MPKFTTAVQDRVWEHLNSTEGDTVLRQEALGLLIEMGFFSRYHYGSDEFKNKESLETLSLLLTRSEFDKFCAPGRQRLLDAAKPPVEYEAVIEIRVPIGPGTTIGDVDFESGTFGGGNSIAGYLTDCLKKPEFKNIGDSHFQKTGDPIVVAKGVEKKK